MLTRSRLAVVAGIASVSVFLTAFVANAAADTSAADAVNGGALTIKDTLVSIGTTVLPYAAAVAALVIGWRFVKKFIKG